MDNSEMNLYSIEVLGRFRGGVIHGEKDLALYKTELRKLTDTLSGLSGLKSMDARLKERITNRLNATKNLVQSKIEIYEDKLESDKKSSEDLTQKREEKKKLIRKAESTARNMEEKRVEAAATVKIMEDEMEKKVEELVKKRRGRPKSK